MIYWKHDTNMVHYRVPTIERGIMVKGSEKIEVVTNEDKFDFVISIDDNLFFVINNKEYDKMGNRLIFQTEIEPIIRKFGTPLNRQA